MLKVLPVAFDGVRLKARAKAKAKEKIAST